MATYTAYTPTNEIAKAMFNFDVFGSSNYKLSGPIRVSVSDTFSFADYLSSPFYPGLYTSVFTSNEVPWTASMLVNIQDILAIYSQFANLTFQWQGDYDLPGSDSTPNPRDVGLFNLSDINITWIDRPDMTFGGIAGGSSGAIFGYTGGAGDIFLNQAWFGDYSLDLNTDARQTLMHELGHSLGLSHPHSAYDPLTITADYAATKDLGFSQLGFRTNSAADMYKEYFTIMSYDDQSVGFQAHTPMILDVIALQAAYGEGPGTSGSGNDTIPVGTLGYRTYFDTGGIDTIDLSMYSGDGAYLHMGASITGAQHLVGVAMSVYDAQNTIVLAGDPAHLRWFYGEYENANGSSNADLIIGNDLPNVIDGLAGADFLNGGGGADVLYGQSGDDNLDGGADADWAAYTTASGPVTVNLGAGTSSGAAGNDTLISIEKVAGSAFGDILIGDANANTLDGNGGTDSLQGGDGTDTLDGGTGNDLLDGGAGHDWASYQSASGPVTVDLGAGTSSGADGADTLTGIESLRGSAFNDTLIGDAGGNLLSGSGGHDALDGGAGLDYADYYGAAGAVTVNLGTNSSSGPDGNDTFANIEGVQGTAFNDSLTGDGANNFLRGMGGQDTLNGGGGMDTASYLNATGGVTVNLATGTATGADGSDTLLSIEGVSGSAFADTIFGDANANTLAGNAGGDSLQGAAGNDTYRFGLGFGQDTVIDVDATVGNLDSAFFETGILPADIGIYRSGTDLVLTWRGSYDQDRITLKYFDVGGAYQIEQVAFDDDPTVWNAAYLLSHVEQPGTVISANNAARIGLTTAVAGMFEVTDPDGGSPYAYELWDGGVGGGYFRVGGAQQAAGVAIPVSAAQLASTDYVGGASIGSETVYARAYDGVLWTGWASWTMFTHNRATNNAPAVNASSVNIDLNQWRSATELVTITDADADAINQIQIRDLNSGASSGYLYGNGAPVAQGSTLTVTSLANVWVNGGPTATSNGYELRAFDGVGWSGWTPFNLTTRAQPNRAPVVSAMNNAQQVGQAAGVSSLVGFSDADGDPVWSYEFYDAGVGGGNFRIGAAAQPALTIIPVSAAQLATTQYVAGASPGSETLWVHGYDGQAWSAWTSWQMFSQPAGANALPVVNAPGRNIDQNQWRQLSELITVSDAEGNPTNQYQITDSTGGAGSAYFYANGVTQAQGATALVNAADLANTWVNGGSDVALNGFSIRAFDTFGWSAPTSLDLTTRAQPNRAPVVSAPNGARQVGQAAGVGSLVGFSDADGDPVWSYEFYDAGVGGGNFRIGAAAQPALTIIPVSAAQLATTQYVAGASPGSETLWVHGYDGQAWSAWTSWQMFSQPAGANALPVVNAPNRNIDQNQWRQLSELITVSDAEGNPINQYQITDSTGGAGSAYFYANGVTQAQGATALVNAADLANTWVNGGSDVAVNGFSIRAFDTFGWSAPTSLNLNTRATPNRAPVVSAPNGARQVGQAAGVGSLVGFSDADGDPVWSYEFYDAGVGGGNFRIGAAAQPALTIIPVSAAQLATTQYVAGASPGSETLWVHGYDGQAWSAWTSWQMFSQPAGANALPVVNAPGRNIDQNQWRQLSELITVSDAEGNPTNQYQITDSTGGAGSAYFYANGVTQAQGATALVNAADLANTWVNGGSDVALNGFSIRAFDTFGWSAPTSLDLTTRAQPNRAPAFTGADQTVVTNQAVMPAALWSVTDADGDMPFSFELYDAGAGGGQFQIGAAAQPALTIIPVSAAQLATTQYVAGSSAGSETLWGRVYDGQAWSNWDSWVITAT